MFLNKTKSTKLKITWILFLWMAWTFNGVYASGEPSPSPRAIQAQWLNIPLSFESNEGQTDPKVKYLMRGQGCTMFFTPENLVMTFKQGENEPSSFLKMQFVGANPNPQIKGLEEQGHKTNYFINNDAKKWRRNISNYKKICYQEVYPGIDVVFYGNGRQLEYDICVAPNANPNQARFQIEGAEKLFIDEKGNLHIAIADQNEIQMLKPFVYQMIEDKQVTIDSQFRLLTGNEVGFTLGNYNPSQLLVIDPVLGYSTYLGGSATDNGVGLAIDNEGNAYVTGASSSINFPTTPGAYQSALAGGSDVFITKINPTGTGLIYSTFLGGPSNDIGRSIAVDDDGNAYITGSTISSLLFPTTPGAFQTVGPGVAGTQSAFITKLDPLGQNLIYSTFLGGGSGTSPSNTGYKIAIDNAGNAYVGGITSSSNFPTTSGAFQTSFQGNQDSFITKINSTGTALIYSTYLGGSANDTLRSISIDNMGSVYATGSTTSLNFPTTPGALQTSRNGSSDAFIAKLNPTGTALVYSTYLGGTSTETSYSIAVDDEGNSYLTGTTTSSNFPVTPGAFQLTLSGSSDAFVTKLNSTGTGLIYSTYLGGTGTETGFTIALDSSNNAYVSGTTSSANFPLTSDAFQSVYGGGTNDAFVTQINATGTDLIYSTYLGGSNTDTPNEIAVDNNQNIYVVGFTSSTNFPTTPGAFQETYTGGLQDTFISRFITPTTTTLNVSPNPTDFGQIVSLTATVSPFAVTGTISFFDGATLLGSVPVVGGIAVFSTDTFTAGNHSLSAEYSGDASFAESISIPVNLVVNRASTTTILGASPNPADFNQMISLTATISPSGATGTVSFFDGATLLDSVPVVGGAAVYSTDAFAVGTHSLTAEYSGDSNYEESTSSPVNLDINRASTVTTLNVSPNPADFEQTVSLTATISPSGATGAVSFFNGATLLDSIPVVGGAAVYSTDAFAVGTHSLTAEYSGDANYEGSTSSPVNLVVNRASTETTLVVSPNPADFGQVVSLTATISPSGTTGTVSFFNGATLLDSVPVVGGAAVYSTDAFAVGIHSLTAEYSGDPNYEESTSSPVNLGVNSSIIPTVTTLIATPNPAVVGQPVTFTATVSPSIATGTVSLFSGFNLSKSHLLESNFSKSHLLGSNLLGTAVVVNGTATIVIPALVRAGIFSVIAIYSGDDNFSGSNSAVTFLTVEPAAPTVLPPRHLRGLQIENQFATQTDVINVLKWKAPASGIQPVAYRIYRGSLNHLLAIVNANQSLVYEDHNRKKGKQYLYFVISEDEFGNFSEPARIVIR